MATTYNKTDEPELESTSTADSSGLQARCSSLISLENIEFSKEPFQRHREKTSRVPLLVGVVVVVVLIVGLCLGLWPCGVGFSGRGVSNCEDIDECKEQAALSHRM